ncbi:MAG: M14 family metallopeptidase [Methylococcales bacterium]
MNTTTLSILNQLPDGLIEAEATALHQILPNPTLIHISGSRSQPIFVSVLLHGNEHTGFLAIQALLKKYQNKPLPRSLSIFFGNVQAAKLAQRRIDTGPDYNRIWPGTEQSESPESHIAQQIVDDMQQRKVFISIDIHNNTGLNPHFACINSLDPNFLHLANLFSRLTVYFLRPKGVQSAAFSKICPAVTLECGKPGVKYGVEHALDYLDTCLHLNNLADHPPAAHDIDLFHTVALVKIRDHISFSFDNDSVDLKLTTNLERMNFTEINAGTTFGIVQPDASMPLISRDESGTDNTDNYFTVHNQQLVSRKAVMPSMLTLNEAVIRQDCLCYLMEKMEVPKKN